MWVIGTVTPSAALTAMAFAFLLINSGVTARRALARGDTGSAAFAAAAAALVAALLAAVRAHERAREAEGARRRRAVVWTLSAALTGMFARRVAGLAPDPAVAALVWAMAGVTVAGGFCCLFVHDGPDDVAGGERDGARPA